MKEPISIPAQARALRSITGLALAHCTRIIIMARAEMQRSAVMKRRRTVAARQLDLEEQPADPATVAAGFAKIREMLAEVQP
jgi:hypothetical protein